MTYDQFLIHVRNAISLDFSDYVEPIAEYIWENELDRAEIYSVQYNLIDYHMKLYNSSNYRINTWFIDRVKANIDRDRQKQGLPPVVPIEQIDFF